MVEPYSLDPQTNVSMETGFVSIHVFDRLMKYDSTGKLVTGILARFPIVSREGTLYAFELRKDIKFSDGRPLTSKDVLFTITRALKPETKGWNTWIFDSVVGAKAVIDGKTERLKGFTIIDENRFTIELEKPYTPFLSGLASPYAGIISQEACEKWGDQWGTKIVGSGPYQVFEWNRGKSLRLIKNSYYWGKEAAYDEIESRFSDDFIQDLAGFRAGVLDEIAVPAEDRDLIEGDTELTEHFVEAPALNIYYLSANMTHPILKDSRIRQAISLGIDREKLCDSIMKNSAKPAYTFLPAGILGHDPRTKIEYNPSRAKTLLIEAGYPKGLELDYPCIQIIDADYALKSMLEQVGIHLKIRKITQDERSKLIKEGKDTITLRYWWADIPDGDNFLYNKFNSQFNRCGNYASAKFDLMSEAARYESDLLKREKLYRDMDWMLCQSDWAVMPLYYGKELALVNKKVKKFYIDPVSSLPTFP